MIQTALMIFSLIIYHWFALGVLWNKLWFCESFGFDEKDPEITQQNWKLGHTLTWTCPVNYWSCCRSVHCLRASIHSCFICHRDGTDSIHIFVSNKTLLGLVKLVLNMYVTHLWLYYYLLVFTIKICVFHFYFKLKKLYNTLSGDSFVIRIGHSHEK